MKQPLIEENLLEVKDTTTHKIEVREEIEDSRDYIGYLYQFINILAACLS